MATRPGCAKPFPLRRRATREPKRHPPHLPKSIAIGWSTPQNWKVSGWPNAYVASAGGWAPWLLDVQPD